MKLRIQAGICCVLLFALMAAGRGQEAKHGPTTFVLACAGGDCPLLRGAPQTRGMRGGSAKLSPGDSMGWHSTGANEEALVILHGAGTANIEGQGDIPLHESMLAYIPPQTNHNVTNTGTDALEYAWIVAPVRDKQ
ncbi:MAG TPA: cupin domain-containing protein [Candidatus Acidoferrum sp.]|nr:cupin domain-containing protein [Candidatus Acidoferrum sp.]